MKLPTHWLIKTEMGYMLEGCDGSLVQFFDMACNSKAYCMEKGIVPAYVTSKSPQSVKEQYEGVTGKDLWFYRSNINGY